MNGNACFESKEFSKAVTWYTRAINAGEVPNWVYWNTACAYAHLGEKTKSFLFLNQALDKGFTDADYIKKSKHFKLWHASQEWAQLIGRLEERNKDN